jgi:hypothetical protein
MIKMNRNNVGLFRWDGRSALRDTASGDQSGNRQLGPDNGNHGIEGNNGWLVHGEILRHLRAMGACWGLMRVRGIPILFAGLSFVHGNLRPKTNGHLIEGRRVPPVSAYFSKGDRNFQQEPTISVFFDKSRTSNCLAATPGGSAQPSTDSQRIRQGS